MPYVSSSQKPLKIQGADKKMRFVKYGEHIPECDSWRHNIIHFNVTHGYIRHVDILPPGSAAPSKGPEPRAHVAPKGPVEAAIKVKGPAADHDATSGAAKKGQ